MLLLFSQLGVSPFSLARPTKCSGHSFPPHQNTVSFILPFPSSYNCVYQVGRGRGLSTTFWLSIGLFKVLFYSLWPGRGWPGPGLLGPTPLGPSHHPHQIGTSKHTQTPALERLIVQSLTLKLDDKRWLL